MQLAVRLATTGEYRADSRSPKWIGYALADALHLPVSYGGDNDPKDIARTRTIIKTWIKNKVLEIDKRKDNEGKDREFIVPGSLKPETTSPSWPTPYIDDELTIQ